MSEEEDVKDFSENGGFLASLNRYRMQAPITDMMLKINERSALYLEFMACAFIQETGLKASECELVSYYNPMDNSFHWEFRKKS